MGASGAPTFGEALRIYRTAAALSQEELADRPGLSLRAVSDLERGARRAPRLETVRLLAEALSLAPAALAEFAAARTAEQPAPRQPLDSVAASVPTPRGPLVGRAHEIAAVRAPSCARTCRW